MSVATELARIQISKNTIRAKLVELGIAQNTDTLDKLADLVESIVNQGAVSAVVQEGDTYTIPKGYHNGCGTVSCVKGGGNYNLQSKTATPTKLQQNITPDSGYYGLSDVAVAPIPESYQDVSAVTAAAEDVLTGKVIVDDKGKAVAGSMPNNGGVDKILAGDVSSYTIPKGFHNGEGVVKILPEAKTVTPTKAAQTVAPAEGRVLSSVTVAAIPDNFVDTTGADAAAGNILAEKTAYVDGEKLIGTMPNNGATGGTIDGLTTVSMTIPAGYTTGGTVSLTDDIEKALAAI